MYYEKMNNTEEGGTIADTELLVVMIGVFINLLLGVYTIYSQTNHKIECHDSLCCADFEFSDTSDSVVAP